MSVCPHDWEGRADQSSTEVQRYRCKSCGRWGWRKFYRGAKSTVTEYPADRSFDVVNVRSTATAAGAMPNVDLVGDDVPVTPRVRPRKW